MADKNKVAVADNYRGHAVEVEHLVEKNINHLHSPVGVFNGDKMRILRELIDHHQYRIASLGRRKTFNKIHSNICPNFRWNEKWLK